MSILINEKDLPQELTAEQAVEAAYSSELAEVALKVQRGLPALIECDKDLAPFLYMNLRNRLRAVNLRCLYLDGRPRQEEQGGAMPMGMMGTMIAQLREAVRGRILFGPLGSPSKPAPTASPHICGRTAVTSGIRI